ncbi:MULTISPECIES: ATP-grasp domain-containing protein [Priestia]|uniref:ATP-grasp domain-containing protein n=1 Tax=Priestia aryabhattai TaxID=412384 RepID=A0ABD5KZJ5_PRIAR|nr:ATP-grasp domain-containing protein [Priestia aryabhattai]WJN47539.1 ATP-grasp domain-containing protein [Priestia aryabhattai]
MNNVLLLGFGTQATEYIKVIKDRGYHLTASDLKTYYELENNQKLSSKIDKFIEYEDFHQETFYKVAIEANQICPLKAVVPLADGHVLPAALVQEKLSLKGPGLHAAIISTNKALQRQLFSMEGISIPSHMQFNIAQAESALNKLDFPIVLKPVNKFGSIGVKIVYSYQEALQHLADIKQHSEVFLAEEYIDGEEFSIESIVQREEIIFTNITKKVLGDKPLFVEKAHLLPYGANLTKELKEKILSLNEKVIKALDVKDSIVHLEIKIGKAGPVVIEVAVRMPGDKIMELIEQSTGINMYSAFVDILLGNTPNLKQTKNTFSSVVWFSAPKYGQLESVKIPENIQQKYNIQTIEFIKTPGDIVQPMTSSFDRLGYCILSCDDYAKLEKHSNRIEKEIEIEII